MKWNLGLLDYWTIGLFFGVTCFSCLLLRRLRAFCRDNKMVHLIHTHTHAHTHKYISVLKIESRIIKKLF